MNPETIVTVCAFLLTVVINTSVISYFMGVISEKVAIYGKQIETLSSGMITAGTEIGDHEARIRVIESKLQKPH